MTPLSTAPFFASLSVHGLHFTVYTPSGKEGQGKCFGKCWPGGQNGVTKKLPKEVLGALQLWPKEQSARGRTRLRGSEVLGPVRGLGIRPLFSAILGYTPSTAGTFRKKFRKNSGKTPETLSKRCLEFPLRVRLGSPKPYDSRHLRLPEHFQNSLPPVRLGTPLVFRSGPERASQSWSWNSQQYRWHFC